MKFLQEMIAKKKASADLPPGAAPVDDEDRLEPFQDILKRDNLDAIHADEDENPVASLHSLSGSNGASISDLEDTYEAKAAPEETGFEDAGAAFEPETVAEPVAAPEVDDPVQSLSPSDAMEAPEDLAPVGAAEDNMNGVAPDSAAHDDLGDLRAHMAPPPMDPTDPYLDDEDEFEDPEDEDIAQAAEPEPETEEPVAANGSGLRLAQAEAPAAQVTEPDIDDLDAHSAEDDLRDAFSGEGAVQRFEPPAEEQIAAKIDERMADAAGKEQPETAAPKKIWDLAKPEGTPAPVPAAAPAEAKPARRAGRVKTRLLGFQSAEDPTNKVFEEKQNSETNAAAMFPVGWIVVIDGPGRGASFALQSGASQIGRGDDQAVKLDFGDTSISRENHAAIAYDDEQNKFFIGHGGKSNLVRLNDMPVLSTEPLTNDDTIRIGETTLKFIAFCGDNFVWEKSGSDAPVGHAANQ